MFWPAKVIMVIRHSQINCSNCFWDPSSSNIYPNKFKSFSDWDAKASFLALGFFIFRAPYALSILLYMLTSGFWDVTNASRRFWESKNRFRTSCSMRVASRSHKSISFASLTYLNCLWSYCSNILWPWLTFDFADLLWLYFWSSDKYTALAFS